MRYLSPKLLFLVAAFAIFPIYAAAQDDPPPPQDPGQFEPQERRPNLLQHLGLTQDQVRQIKTMNRERKPMMDAAQRRLREASRSLDMAIYGDVLDENAVRESLREFQQAQAEVARIRFQSEFELRKILTPEQLVGFRGLRARAAEARRKMGPRPDMPPGERPVQRIRQLPNRPPVN